MRMRFQTFCDFQAGCPRLTINKDFKFHDAFINLIKQDDKRLNYVMAQGIR
jgi:hypothetical protein